MQIICAIADRAPEGWDEEKQFRIHRPNSNLIGSLFLHALNSI